MGIRLRQAAAGALLVGTLSGQVLVWNQTTQLWDVSSVPVVARTSPVYIEDYLVDAGGDIRTAIRTAWLATPDASEYIYPAGRFEFVGAALTLADGYRNDVIHTGQNTELFRDVEGVATGQQIFFLRTDTGVGHASGITWRGFKFSLLNALTSYFGYAIGMLSSSDCTVTDCDFFCSLDAAATTGRIRWGLGLFGGTGSDGGGERNFVDRIRMTLSQLQLCAGPNSVDGIICQNIESFSNNDYVLSCVSSPGGSVRNVTIKNILAHDVGGSGCVFLGSDGAGTATGADVVENITLSGVSVDGAKDPDLDFNTASLVLIDLGVVTRNVSVSQVNTVLSSTELQTRSITIASQDDETLSQGVSVSDCQLGIVTTNDPLEPLFIQGRTLDRVQITNVSIEGLRGLRLVDCDYVTISNLNMLDGELLVQAVSRNLTRFSLSNFNITRTTSFTTAVAFQSTTSKSFGDVIIGDGTWLDNNGASGGLFLSTGAAAGTTRFMLSNIRWITGTSSPNAATAAAIQRAVNCSGLILLTTVSVTVPAVAAGSVGYVTQSMAGTRLADLGQHEGVVVNPQSDLVAAGVGGGFINARVSAAGSVRLAFLGPLAGGAADFTFARAAE